MRIASITEAKNRLSALIDEVRSGETVLIVDRGIPVARLEPAATLSNDDDGRLARLQRTGAVRVASKPPPLELIREEPPGTRNNASVVHELIEERRSGR
jgi:prevent-host-death family protein